MHLVTAPSEHLSAAVDPVWGMTVNPPTKAGSVGHEGTTHHFCSTGYRGKSAPDPER